MPCTSPAPVETQPTLETVQTPVLRRADLFAWTALGLFLVAFVPLFLRMEVNPDFWNYQVIAQRLLHGEAPEKELNVFCKPAMMTWLLAGAYQVVGWQDVAVRGLDLAFLSGVIWLLLRWLKPLRLSQAAQVWLALAMYAFYFSLYELSQCQPDLWMLLPALAGLLLRRRQVAYQATAEATTPAAVGRAFGEGLCWGAACLFKPFVVIPGFLCWLASAALIGRTAPKPLRRGLADAAGLLAGGLFAAGVWLGYLKWLGGWDSFWQDFADWHSGYYSLGPSLGQRTLLVFTQFFPWGAVQWVALPLAVIALVRALRGTPQKGTLDLVGLPYGESLLAGMYLGWFFQANYIQYQVTYHLVPAMLLALALAIGHFCYRSSWQTIGKRPWLSVQTAFGELSLPRPTVVVLLLCLVTVLVLRFPLAYPKRLGLWPQCWLETDFPKLEDDLTCMNVHEFATAQWGGFWEQQIFPQRNADLVRVAKYLKDQGVKDGELTAHAQLATFLYVKLPTKPSTRFHYFTPELYIYWKHWRRFQEALNDSQQRYAVSDVRELMPDLPEKVLQTTWTEDQLTLPPKFPEAYKDVFPWCEPIVFRAGFFCVHEVTRPVQWLVPPDWDMNALDESSSPMPQ